MQGSVYSFVCGCFPVRHHSELLHRFGVNDRRQFDRCVVYIQLGSRTGLAIILVNPVIDNAVGFSNQIPGNSTYERKQH